MSKFFEDISLKATIISTTVAFGCGMFGTFLVFVFCGYFFLKRNKHLPPFFKPKSKKSKKPKKPKKPTPKERGYE